MRSVTVTNHSQLLTVLYVAEMTCYKVKGLPHIAKDFSISFSLTFLNGKFWTAVMKKRVS